MSITFYLKCNYFLLNFIPHDRNIQMFTNDQIKHFDSVYLLNYHTVHIISLMRSVGHFSLF